MSMDLLQVVAAIDANETVMADSYVVTSAYVHIAEREARALTAERERRESAERQREDIKRMLRAERERREELRTALEDAYKWLRRARSAVREGWADPHRVEQYNDACRRVGQQVLDLAPLPDRGERG